MQGKIAAWSKRTVRIPIPWSNWYGIARSTLALSPLLTLMCTRPENLFFPTEGMNQAVHCDGLSRYGLFCLDHGDHLDLLRWISILTLILVASGWRPRITCIPHWYVAISFFTNCVIPEGGDQISAIMALLLIPACLSDPRRWHWVAMASTDGDRKQSTVAKLSTTAGAIAIGVAKLQVSWVYLQSGISKLSHDVWIDGTAMYYWFRHAYFGAPGWSRPVLLSLSSQPVTEAVITWSPIALEVTLGVSLLLPRRLKVKFLLPAGITFHFLIGLSMGLWSFAFAMWGALIILLIPAGSQIQSAHITRRLRGVLNRAKPQSHDKDKAQHVENIDRGRDTSRRTDEHVTAC
ncbi:sporulation-delaying protein SdpB family protein [Skermania sp. ID1734]|uniref:sporulation-delaying protein SdpB family protein n=1 Tax=Skermania sp. ID1734 TaxID=2597516 RepID=UPI002105A76C|nr:sporulation-delaying protein SdpB family protein [Skermania sp. ID1734]